MEARLGKDSGSRDVMDVCHPRHLPRRTVFHRTPTYEHSLGNQFDTSAYTAAKTQYSTASCAIIEKVRADLAVSGTAFVPTGLAAVDIVLGAGVEIFGTGAAEY